MAATPEARLKIVAENLARAALAELKRDVQATGTAAGGASTGFGRMVFANGQLIASTSTARRGLNIMENGLRTLAFQAAGVPGTFGKVAAGFGLLGAGSLVVTGVVAGVGAIALGYRLITRDAREAGEAADKLTDSLKRQTLGGQLRGIGGNLTEAGAGVASAQRRAEAGSGSPINLWEWVAWIRQGALETAGEKAVAAVMAVQEARHQAGRDTTQLMEREADLIGLTTAEAARLKASWLSLTDAETANYVAAATRLDRRKEETRVLAAQKDLLQEIGAISREVETFGAFAAPDLAGLKLPDIFAQESARQASLRVAQLEQEGGQFAFGLDQDFFDRAQADVDRAIASFPEQAGTRTGVLIAQSFLSAVQLAQQGGAGGIFGAGGALLTGLSEIKGLESLGPFGIVASTFGAVFSLFDRKSDERERAEERRHRELLGTLHEGFLRVTFINADGTAEAGLYEMRRAERLGGEPRLGGI